MLETSTDYRTPYRPLPIALFNRIAAFAGRLGLKQRLDVGRLIAAARRKTGLHDFGDDWFMEPLQVLVRSINEEARLNATGFLLQKLRIVSALSVRLRAHKLLSDNPEIAEIDLGKILLIAGLQRTGTTTLHRLLCSHPDIRGLYSWEMLNPLPLPGEKQGSAHKRLKQAKIAEKTMRFMAPEFFAIHPIEFDAPEEDIFLLDLSFMSQAPEATMHVPTYAKWLEKQDHTRCYEYMRTMLRLMHWRRPEKAWVLKTPHHMEHLGVICNVFPGISIIQTHRDPKKSMVSFFSMVAHGRGLLSDHVQPHEISAHWLEKTKRLMRLSIDYRKSVDSRDFIDISYYELIRDPIAQLRKIYRRSGIDCSDSSLNSAKKLAKHNVKNRYGKHVYDTDSFGLDRSAIDKQCEFYTREYGIDDEK